jgi:5-methylcytosine-specific restriction endonuclease McrA
MSRIRDRAKKLKYLLKGVEPTCHYCGNPLVIDPDERGVLRDNQLTLDHIVPRSLGGTDHLENLVLSCAGCNQWKGSLKYENHCTRCIARFAKVAKEEARMAAIPKDVARRVAKLRARLRRRPPRRR